MSGSLLKNTLLYMPAQLLGPLLQFGVTIIWTHLLAPADFGVVTFVVASQEIVALIGIAWWSIFVVRFQKRYAEGDARRFRTMERLARQRGVTLAEVPRPEMESFWERAKVQEQEARTENAHA